ncbi:MAG: response regulator receiver protein [Verrucomicrobia bacterium]|nr:response regulator receiver protein [Verrucomicrobiota bacterium]
MRHKLLTVDDSKTVRIIVRKAFKEFNCDTLEAANGIEGLAIACSQLPDLILLDVTMPVMGGLEMLAKLKADPELQHIPVMLLLAAEGHEQVEKLTQGDVRDYLLKPFKREVLLEKATRIVDLKLSTRTAAHAIASA